MNTEGKAILFIGYYPPNISPGQRFRIEAYLHLLREYEYFFTIESFLTTENFAASLYKTGLLPQVRAIMAGFGRRIKMLLYINKYNYVFIYREVTPIGPPIFEWIIAKIFKKKIIYDFDDAIWMPYKHTESGFITRLLKNKGKVKHICTWSYKVSCGNEFLCAYARNFNKNVVFNPTCVDTNRRYNLTASHAVKQIVIGWTGSFSTINYLEDLAPILSKLQEKYDFVLKVICNKAPQMPSIKNVQYVEWTAENELIELAECQIGLMPLTAELWSEGKCGFKLIQYMALGIAAVGSPVGVNTQIVEHGFSGLLCSSPDEWYDAIEKLLNNADLRESIAKNGREVIAKRYSVASNSKNFLALFT